MNYKDAKHLIVDIETLGIKSPSPILSIASVVHAPEINGAIEPISYLIDLKSHEGTPATPEYETILFWIKQHPNAIEDAFFGKNRIPIRNAIGVFSEYCQRIDPDFYWDTGRFDFTHLEHWMKYFDIPIPWKYYQLRDIRTMCNYDVVPAGVNEELKRKFPPHVAINDVFRERMLLKLAIEKLTKGE